MPFGSIKVISSGICPYACVAQDKHGSYARIATSTAFIMPSVISFFPFIMAFATKLTALFMGSLLFVVETFMLHSVIWSLLLTLYSWNKVPRGASITPTPLACLVPLVTRLSLCRSESFKRSLIISAACIVSISLAQCVCMHLLFTLPVKLLYSSNSFCAIGDGIKSAVFKRASGPTLYQPFSFPMDIM